MIQIWTLFNYATPSVPLCKGEDKAMGHIYNRKETNDLRRRLRKDATKAEKILWTRIQKKQILNTKFRRQFAIGEFVVDFYAPRLKFVIEVDGEYHLTSGALVRDKEREDFLMEHGVKIILRITNDEVYNDIYGVLEKITNAINKFPLLTKEGIGEVESL